MTSDTQSSTPPHLSLKMSFSHSHRYKGKNKAQDNRFRDYTDDRSRPEEGILNGTRTEMHEHQQGTLGHGGCVCWDPDGSWPYREFIWEVLTQVKNVTVFLNWMPLVVFLLCPLIKTPWTRGHVCTYIITCSSHLFKQRFQIRIVSCSACVLSFAAPLCQSCRAGSVSQQESGESDWFRCGASGDRTLWLSGGMTVGTCISTVRSTGDRRRRMTTVQLIILKEWNLSGGGSTGIK